MPLGQLLEPGKCLLNSVNIEWLKTYCHGALLHISAISIFNVIILSLHPLCFCKLILIQPSEALHTMPMFSYLSDIQDDSPSWSAQHFFLLRVSYLYISQTHPKCDLLRSFIVVTSILFLTINPKCALWKGEITIQMQDTSENVFLFDLKGYAEDFRVKESWEIWARKK